MVQLLLDGTAASAQSAAYFNSTMVQLLRLQQMQLCKSKEISIPLWFNYYYENK